MEATLTLRSEKLTATLSACGARLDTLCVGSGPSLVLHAGGDHVDLWRACYAGAIVGPVANRVAGGRVPIGDRTFQMPCNEAGVTALHSGPDGLDVRIWSVQACSDSRVHYQTVLGDGESGLPGHRVIDATYTLEAESLTVEIHATTDAPSPINIAHHPYWRLGDARAHRLQIEADTYLPVTDLNLPTGQIAAVAGTRFDHRQPKVVDPGLDHNFCLARAERTAPAPVATLLGADGVRLHIESTAPGLQVYAGSGLPCLAGTDIAPGAGLALEPQGWPDAVNRAGFPHSIYTPDRPYRQVTRYRIAT
ncbi:MAG: aldose epimerase family protein [Pseudomonadota bacterium]